MIAAEVRPDEIHFIPNTAVGLPEEEYLDYVRKTMARFEGRRVMLRNNSTNSTGFCEGVLVMESDESYSIKDNMGFRHRFVDLEVTELVPRDYQGDRLPQYQFNSAELYIGERAAIRGRLKGLPARYLLAVPYCCRGMTLQPL